MITIEAFLGLTCKDILKHFASLGYTQNSDIFSHPNFKDKYDFSTGKTTYSPKDKMLEVLGIEDPRNSVESLWGNNSTLRTHGGYFVITLDPNKLQVGNKPAGIALPKLMFEYHLWDTSKKISRVNIKSESHGNGVFDESPYWIASDQIFDTRPEYTKFGLGIAYDYSTQTVSEHIADLYNAANTKGRKAQEFCDRSFAGELKSEIKKLTGEDIPFNRSGMDHSKFCGYLEWCVEEGLEFSDFVALCAATGIGVCGNTMMKTISLIRDESKDIRQKAQAIKNYFSQTAGTKTKAEILTEAYTDLSEQTKLIREIVAKKYGLAEADMSDIVINGKKL